MQLRQALVFASLLAGSAVAVLTSKEVKDGIDDITKQSGDLQDPVEKLSPFNIITTGPKIVQGLGQIVADLNVDLARWGTTAMCTGRARLHGAAPRVHQPARSLQNGPPFQGDEAQQVCDAFREFVRVHQQLLGIVIGRRSAFSATPVLKPMTAVLRDLESTVDATAFEVIELVPPCAGQVSEDRNKIDKTLADSVKTYSSPAFVREQMPAALLGSYMDIDWESLKAGAHAEHEQVNINIELA